MKKIYINPEINVVKIQTSQFVCVSGQLSDEQITEVGQIGAKGGGWSWSDDEPEDE